MAELKPGWQRVKFGDVVRLNKETCKDPAAEGIERVIGLEHLEPGDLRIRSWGNVADGTKFTNRVRPGQVLFGKRRAYQRKVAVADFDAVCSGDILVFESKGSDRLLSDLLPYICQSDAFCSHAVGTSAGSLSPRTSWKHMAEYSFLLPPTDEQARIASALCAQSRLVEALGSVISASRQVETAIVFSAIQAFDEAYPVRSLGSGCRRVTDGTHQPPEFTESGVPFFLVKTISGGYVDWQYIKFVSSKTYAELTRNIKPCRGHVLYTAVGATYGVAKLVDFDEPFVFQRHIAHIVPDETILLGEYVELFLNSPVGKRLSDKHAIGSAQPTVTLRSLSSFPIPCPPIEEQEKLIKKVAKVRSASYEARRRHAKARSDLLVATRGISL